MIQSQSVGNAATSTVAFAVDVDARITGTRYEMCDGQEFFCADFVNTFNGGTACIFASDSQLDLLSATTALTAPYAEVQYLLLFTLIIRNETY